MTRWSDELAKKLTKAHQARRGNKYGAVKVTGDEGSFDSKGEAELFGTLKLMERAGELSNIRRQVVIQLTQKVKWRADFVAFDERKKRDEIHEFKGFQDLRFKVLLQLIPEFCPLPVKIWGKKGSRLFISKEIEGKK
jgi:hypothetical protein